ncbi:MAG TPA: MFS transporter [Gaiellaceae bacterium]|nr:MFS transporter [Gaiellaceae bacterium]
MRRILSHRDTRLLLAGQTLSAFGDWALMIVLAVWMKDLTGSNAHAGLTFFVFGAGSLVGPLGGLLADRVRRRRLMIATDAVLGLSVLALLFVHDSGDAWLIYAVALVYGLGGTIFSPARSALLRVMLPDELLADANGALATTQEGLRIVAPLAGAGLYAAFGGGVVAILDSATFAASVFFLWRMRVVEVKPAPPEHHFLREVTAGFRHVARTAPLRDIVLGLSLAMLVIGFSETLLFYVMHAIGKPASFFGVFSTIQGVGSIAGGLTAARVIRRVGEARGLGLGLAAFAVADLCLVLPSLPAVIVAAPIAGVGIAWAVVAFGTALQTNTPLQIQGRVAAAANLAFSVTQTTSIALGAALSAVVDYRLLFVVMAAVVFASASFLLTRHRDPAPVLERAAA